MRTIITTLAILMLAGCGSDDSPPAPPEASVLVFPERNSECTTGVDISETISQVTFEWEAADFTDTYTLNVTNLETEGVQSISTIATSATLSIAKGQAFSWSVVSENNSTDSRATSSEWLFYNAGPQVNYAPFPAQLQSPANADTVQLGNGEQLLSWTGADVENDIVRYEILVSETFPPENLAGTSTETGFSVTVEPGKVYFWSVRTIDAQGNSSQSGIYSFKVL